MILLLLLTAALASIQLHGQPFWFDEWVSMRYSGGDFYGPMTFVQIWERIASGDTTQAPAYYLILSVWGQFTGWTPFALRAFSWLVGLLAVAWTYRAARELHSHAAGLWAAFALGTCAFFIYYLHEARMYTLTPLLCAVTLWAYARSQRRFSVLVAAVLLIAACGLPYTHYVSIVIPAALGVYHVLFAARTDKRRWWIVLAILISVAVLYLPWVSVTVQGAAITQADIGRTSAARPPQIALTSLATLFSNGSLALLGIFAVFALDWWRFRRGAAKASIPWAVLVVGLIGVLAINAVVPFLTGMRYVLMLFPVIAVLVGIGAARLLPILHLHQLHALSRVLVGAWLIGGVWVSINPASFLDSWTTYLRWDRLSDTLRPLAAADDGVIFMMPSGVPDWLHEAVSTYYFHDIPIRMVWAESFAHYLPEQIDAELEPITREARSRLWVTYAPDQPPFVLMPRGVRLHLQNDYITCATRFADAEISGQLFVRVRETAPFVTFAAEGGDTSVSINDVPPSVAAGDFVRFTVELAIPADVPVNTYSIGLHVQDERGALVSQQDAALPIPEAIQSPNAVYNACVGASIPTAGLPPGRYDLYAVMYRWETGERLIGRSGDQAADRVLIGSLEITSAP